MSTSEEIIYRQGEERILWIDFLRGMAILAVLLDHTYNLLYDSEILHRTSYFSVTLFVMLAGVTSFLSYDKHSNFRYGKSIWRKLMHILIPYAIGTAGHLLLAYKVLDIRTFVTTFLSFNGTAHIILYCFIFSLLSFHLCCIDC